MNKPLILVVEDDAAVRNLITTTLRAHQYRFLTATNGESAVLEASSHNPEIVLLDLGLPDIDGVEVIRRIRSWSNLPIIVISARSEDTDKIDALDAGADDYLTKPFATEELLARVRALSRRQGEVVLEALEYGDLKLDLSTHDLRRGNRSVRLNRKEFDVLHLLMANSRIIVPKETLITKVWGYESNAEANNLEAYISFLRKKLIYLDSCVSIITLRKVGYRLEGGEA